MIAHLLRMPLWRPLKDRFFTDRMFLIALTLRVLDIVGTGVQLSTTLAVASVRKFD